MAPEGTVILCLLLGASAPCLPFLPSAVKQLTTSELSCDGDEEYITFLLYLSTPFHTFFIFFGFFSIIFKKS